MVNTSNTPIFDRYHKAALFICGYCSLPEDRAKDIADIFRKRAEQETPYILCRCKKCNTDVELDFYEGDDEECSQPHYYCPKCYANYYDKQGTEPWPELDDYYEDLREQLMEQQFDNDEDW